jgi:hypothetical protein
MKRLEKGKPFSNEGALRTFAKPAKDRAKIALVALFPALWLAASGQPLLGLCDGSGSSSPCNSTCTAECGKQRPSHPFGSPDFSARPVRSRLGPQVGNSNPLLLEPVTHSEAGERRPVAAFAKRESPLALAASWQFACRAAADPRAPSLVS